MARILLVEDNELSLDMLSRRLERIGHEVIIARDGATAVEKAKTDRPDLVLMDMSLPEIDGWEATRRLREDHGTRHLPVIALTAHAMAGDRERALGAGCNEYETKPVDFERLKSKIDLLLG